MDLAWNTSTDDVGVAAYIMLRDGQRLARVTAPKTTYDDTSVNANTTYTYRVRARDAAGNRSKVSRKVIASTANQVVVAAAGDVACAPDDPNYHNGTGTRPPVASSPPRTCLSTDTSTPSSRFRSPYAAAR